jgi:hypothetical protein
LNNNYIKLDDRFSIGTDPHNIILKDKKQTTNKGYSYHKNVHQVISKIFTQLENDAIVVGELDPNKYFDHSIDLCSSIGLLTHDISLLIEKKLKQLKKDLE